MHYGHCEIAFSILGIEPQLSLKELLRRMEDASSVKLTGWTPFIRLDRPPYQPRPIDGMIEAWVGDPAGNSWTGRGSVTCDFWRAYQTAKFCRLVACDE